MIPDAETRGPGAIMGMLCATGYGSCTHWQVNVLLPPLWGILSPREWGAAFRFSEVFGLVPLRPEPTCWCWWASFSRAVEQPGSICRHRVFLTCVSDGYPGHLYGSV